jgi:hypothetical protein
VKRKIKIGILPVETAGYVQGLEHGLKSIGFDVQAVSIDKNPANYTQIAKNPLWSKWLSSISENMNTNSLFLYPFFYLVSLSLRVFGTLWVVMRFTVLILNNGRSLLPFHLDLIVYRLFGLRIIAMMGHGSEIRPACIDSLGSTDNFSKRIRKRIYAKCASRKNYARRVENLSSLVISTPTLSHYLRRKFVNGHLLGIPVLNPLESIERETQNKGRELSGKIRIVHIPSEPILKGTAIISEVCERLVTEGLIEFETQTRITHVRALQMLSEADLLVDQLYSDLYMPVLATEAAFLEVPSIVAGYAWEFLNGTSSRKSQPPVINIDPEDLESKIRSLVSSPQEIKKIGKQARAFVTESRNPIVVARMYASLIYGDREFIEEISVTPNLKHYSWGCGSSKKAILALSRGSTKPHKCF